MEEFYFPGDKKDLDFCDHVFAQRSKFMEKQRNLPMIRA